MPRSRKHLGSDHCLTVPAPARPHELRKKLARRQRTVQYGGCQNLSPVGTKHRGKGLGGCGQEPNAKGTLVRTMVEQRAIYAVFSFGSFALFLYTCMDHVPGGANQVDQPRGDGAAEPGG